MNFKGKDIINIEDLSRKELDHILSVSEKMIPIIKKGSTLCKGKILANLFFEPSTRTRLSFSSAMLRLGGNTIGFADPNSTSGKKGEVLADAIRVIDGYADIIVMRHPIEGSAKVAADFADAPVINAGDGGHHHPTQTILDLFTIKKELGKIDGLNVGFCGDLKYGRTVHSLACALSKYKDVEITCISPESLKMPRYVINHLKMNGIHVTERENIEKSIEDLDVVYATRIQKERFGSEKEYLDVKGSYYIDENTMKKAKEKMILMHPLPRVDEIRYSVDSDRRAVYFKQAHYGVPTRMALIALLLGKVK
ncbi:MAG: aspartate carbamoyltransferase [archaeon]